MSASPIDEKAVFNTARQIGDVAAREDYLRIACRDAPEALPRISQLLRAHDQAQSFLEHPARAFAPTINEPQPAPSPGGMIGPYKLLEQIGEGGFGIVYMAEQTEPVRRRVALKVLKPGMDTRQVVARFEAERQALALMDHPHIAKVFDGGTTGGGERGQRSEDRGQKPVVGPDKAGMQLLASDICPLTSASGRPYFVMELVKGAPITDYSDQQHLSLRERLELFIPVCQAVQHAHQKGIIHRDLKPSNVLVTVHDTRPVAKVIDFGVAKALGQELTDKTLFTGFAQMVGTPLYMSPEQAGQSGLDIDTRSDVYSLGVLLYELLTGTTPFSKQRLQQAAYDEIRRIIREEDPPKPSTRLSELDKSSRHSPSAAADSFSAPRHNTGHGTRRVPATPCSSLASISAVRRIEPHRLTRLLRGELDWIVMRCLEKDRARRYPTAQGLANDIQRFLADEPVEAGPPSAAYRFRKFARRNRGTLAAAATVAAALLIAVVGLAVSNVLVTAERDEKVQALGEKETALKEKGEALIAKAAALDESEKNFAEARRQEGLAKEHARREQEQKHIVEQQKRVVEEKKTLAEEQEQLAKRRYYAAQMNLAMQAWKAGEAPRVLELLESQRPGEDEPDLRGFEWYYLWGLCNGGRRLYLHGHTGAVLSVDFSPDGRTLASASWDGTVRLWDTATGDVRQILRGHERSPWTVAFSPDGKTLASSGQHTQSLILWDVDTGRRRLTMEGSVVRLAWSRDSAIIAGSLLAKSGPQMQLWDAATGSVRTTLPGVGYPLGFLPDGKSLALQTGNGSPSELTLWDVESGVQRLLPLEAGVSAIALSADGKRLATASWEAPTSVWDIHTGLRVASLPRQSIMRGLAFSPDRKLLAAAGEDRTVTVWDVESGRRIGQELHLDPVWGLAFSPDGKTLASSTLAGAIKLWDMMPAEEATTIPSIGGQALRFDSTGQSLLIGDPGPTKIVDVAAGKEAAVLPARGVMAISADGNVLAGSGDPDRGALWDVRAGRAMTGFPLPRPPDTHPGLAVSPNGQFVATHYKFRGGDTVKVWDIARQESRTLTMEPPDRSVSVMCAEFSPDGKLLAAGFQFQHVTVWDVATGKVKLQFSQPPAMMWVMSVAFSPESKALAVGTDVGTVTLWEIDSGRRLASFRGHTSSVRRLAFSPDGRTLATAGTDQTVRLWDVLTGQERCTLTGHRAPVVNVQFSPDGNTLATAGGDGTVKLWRAATDPEALARRRSSVAPNAQVAAQFSSSARRLVMSRAPAERDPARALELANKAIALDPSQASNWVALALAQARVEEWPAADVSYQKSTELDPHGTYPHVSFGNVLLDMGKPDEAIVCYRKALDLDPRCAVAHNNMGVALKRLGRLTPDEAIAHYRQTIELDPQWAPAHVSLGWNLREQEKWDEATACFHQALELDPQSADAYYNLSLILGEQKKLDEAIDACRKAIAINPQEADTHYQLGRFLHLQEKWDEAAVSYKEAIRIAPADARHHFALGNALQRQGQLAQALAAWRKAVELDPSHSQAINSVAWYLVQSSDPTLRDPAEGVRLARAAVALAADNWAYQHTLAVACYRTGDFRACLSALGKSMELRSGGDAHEWFFLGMAHWQLGDEAEARRWHDRAVAWLSQQQNVNEELRSFHAEAAALLKLPVPAAPTLALPPGAITPADRIADLRRRKAALDERAAAASDSSQERWQLATDYSQLAQAFKELDQLSEAETAFRRALESFQFLASEIPQEIQFDYDIGWASHALADLLMKSGRLDEAATWARDSLARFRTVAEAWPDSPDYHNAVHVSSGLLASLLERLDHAEEAAQARSESEAAAQTAGELRRTLPTPQTLQDAAREFANVRNWAQAAAELNKGFERQHRSDRFLCYSAALARLLSGDVEGYAGLAGRVLETTPLKWSRWHGADIVRTCTLHPSGAADPAALLPLAKSDFDREANNWTTQNLGMAHYRAGEFEEALTWMKKSQELHEWYLFYPALAMVHHHLGHSDAARQWAEKAIEIFDLNSHEKSPHAMGYRNAPFWQDWAYFEVLLQEARTLMPQVFEEVQSRRETRLTELLARRATLDQRAAAAPADLRERLNVGAEYFQIAVTLRDLRRWSEAEAVCLDTLRLLQRIADDGLANNELEWHIGWVNHLLSDVLTGLARWEESEPYAQESIRRFQSLIKARPGAAEYYDALAVANGPLIHILGALKKPQGSAEAERAAAAAREKATELRQLPSAQARLDAARTFAERRDWKRAAAELGTGFEQASPDDQHFWFSLAVTRLLAGDDAGYEALVRRIPERFRGQEHYHVIQTCLLRPAGGAPPADVLQWARRAYEAEQNNLTAFDLGLAHYRAGEFAHARQHLDEACQLADWFLYWPALALTHHRLGHSEAARDWLAKAEAAFREHKGDGERIKYLDEHPWWQTWALFEALLLEAREAIGHQELSNKASD